MKSYIGVKLVEAEPMDKGECFDLLGKSDEVLTSTCAAQRGYLVVYPDGYKSWSPKEVFEAAYLQGGKGEPYQAIADRLCKNIVVVQVGSRTLSGTLICLSGFEVSATVMAENEQDLTSNYDHHLTELTRKTNAKLLEHIRFVAILARNGINPNAHTEAFEVMDKQNA